ncbi:hypothetical protein KBB96_01700 [Luteolibacter ambystomatis]|uniref:Zinc ribbon domain-containing protein n=1 Tax=Luteolibacter ambystomatis TaxID=2824561 RepID=A0A975J080_9BACT|nr:hypothetical protein [Luteolibacter ambystomatis]QUE51620.1 hypothetical protein KBB96_01700 [Luteolibacter ambystomatis]
MNIVRISCKACDTPLAISEGIRHLTCHRCGARLEVSYDARSILVSIAEASENQTEVEILKLRMQLERLDEERRHAQDILRVRREFNWSRGPAIANSEDFGFLLLVIGLVVAVMSLVHGLFFPESLVGLAMAVIGVICRLKGCEATAKEEADYARRRQDLVSRIHALQHPSDGEDAPSAKLREKVGQ